MRIYSMIQSYHPITIIDMLRKYIHIACMCLLVIGGWLFLFSPALSLSKASSPVYAQTFTTFFSSVDTMKSSRDTERRPLSDAQINQIVQASASLGNEYITVDTHWEYAWYTQRWVNAIRLVHKKVWFRMMPNQWENNNGTTGILSPAIYEEQLTSFILNHPSLFQSQDIFDADPEPENGKYWKATYGNTWTRNAPNIATHAYNAFIRDTTTLATQSFNHLGIYGIYTTIRSTNAFFPTHPRIFEAQTVQLLGVITIDSYPDQSTTDPVKATNARINELIKIEHIWHVPIVLGEIGYSNRINVDNNTQHRVLSQEFEALRKLSFVQGANYWVGIGGPHAGGFTYLFTPGTSGWILRPAGNDVKNFFMHEDAAHMCLVSSNFICTFQIKLVTFFT